MYKKVYKTTARVASRVEWNELRDGWRETQKCKKITRKLVSVLTTIDGPVVREVGYNEIVLWFNSWKMFLIS
jgi:hypothetical protein